MGVPVIRLQNIINTNDSLQVTYIREEDIDQNTGIMEARTIDFPHGALDQRLMDELLDVVHQIIDEARVLRRRPDETAAATPR